MLKLDVKNLKNENVKSLDIPDNVFGIPFNGSLVHSTVVNFLANQRVGTHKVKDRTEVAGSGKKLWKQKHTGRARVGEIRSPLWRHGGIVFGPRPRDYSSTMPEKMRHGAMRCLLSERLKKGMIAGIEDLSMESAKTKDFIKKYVNFISTHHSCLFMDEKADASVKQAARNIPKVKIMGINEVNVYDLALYEMIYITEKGLKRLCEVLKP